MHEFVDSGLYFNYKNFYAFNNLCMYPLSTENTVLRDLLSSLKTLMMSITVYVTMI